MTEEQIIAAAGEPVAHKDIEARSRIIFPPFKPEKNDDGWMALYTADAILSAAKPLRDRIAELEAEVERFGAEQLVMNIAESKLRQQNAELTKQRDGFLSALESIKNASQASCSFHDIRVFASEAIAKYK